MIVSPFLLYFQAFLVAGWNPLRGPPPLAKTREGQGTPRGARQTAPRPHSAQRERGGHPPSTRAGGRPERAAIAPTTADGSWGSTDDSRLISLIQMYWFNLVLQQKRQINVPQTRRKSDLPGPTTKHPAPAPSPPTQHPMPPIRHQSIPKRRTRFQDDSKILRKRSPNHTKTTPTKTRPQSP